MGHTNGEHANRSGDLLPTLLSSLVFGWSFFRPLPKRATLQERLASIPTEQLPIELPVVIHWNDNQIPFIEAQTDDDLAFAVGLVSAHLRLGQMEISRRIASGRLAEMGGPAATDLDHSLRIVNVGHAVDEMEAVLPDDTRAWLENYVRGVNHYVASAEHLPPEFAILGFEREPWTCADVLRLGRLTSTDVNWLVWLPLLRLREREDWDHLWDRLIETGGASLPSFRKPTRLALLSRLLSSLSRSGSNSIAVAARRSETRSALIANDPHLNITLPNLWFTIGYKSPSYHAVGMMLAGLPFLGLGRNPWIAWGGTNMRAASSDLYDVSGLDDDEITERQETIKVRGWFDHTVRVRECRHGPILSDSPVFKGVAKGAPPFALRWLGHDASDELTAMLRMNRARNWQEFRTSFKTFAVPGLNMLYADVQGNIGQLLAVQLPNRNGFKPRDLILDPDEEGTQWGDLLTADDFPTSFNPRSGFLVSANNRPVDTNITISYFFAPDDRMARINDLMSGQDKIGLADLQAAQQDVYMSSAVTLKERLLGKIALHGVDRELAPAERNVVALLRAWDGHYRADSRGALAFELFLFHFTKLFSGDEIAEYAAAAHAGVVRLKALLIDDLNRADPEDLKAILHAALGRAAAALEKHTSWGDLHRLGLLHPLSMLPIVGNRYRFGEHPTGGSTDTVMKTAHGLTDQRHVTPYGANARHISDLSDLDRNFFVLLGGQDGWLKSRNFIDQVPLWLSGTYVQVPLRIETVRATFPHRTTLSPRQRTAPGNGGEA